MWRGEEEREREERERGGGTGEGRAEREKTEEWNGFANKPSCTVGDVGNCRWQCEIQSDGCSFTWRMPQNGEDGSFYDNITHFADRAVLHPPQADYTRVLLHASLSFFFLSQNTFVGLAPSFLALISPASFTTCVIISSHPLIINA